MTKNIFFTIALIASLSIQVDLSGMEKQKTNKYLTVEDALTIQENCLNMKNFITKEEFLRRQFSVLEKISEKKPTNSIGWEFLLRHKIKPRHEKVGKEIKVVSDEYKQTFVVRKLNEHVITIQLPVETQKGLQCGANSVVYSEKLWNAKTLPELENLLYNQSKKTNTKSKIRSLTKKYKEDWSTDEMMDALPGKKTSFSRKNINGIRLRLINNFDEQKEPDLISGYQIDEAIECLKFQPEVMILHEPGHWYTVRVEQLPCGMLAIIIIDSIIPFMLDYKKNELIKLGKWLKM